MARTLASVRRELAEARAATEAINKTAAEQSATIRRYETWAREQGIQLPVDVSTTWSALVDYGTQLSAGQLVSKPQLQREGELFEELSRATGVSVGTLRLTRANQVKGAMRNPETKSGLPSWAKLREHEQKFDAHFGFDCAPQAVKDGIAR